MPWTRPTLAEIKTRMESDVTSRLTGGAPLLRFSLLKVLITGFAAAVHMLHGFIAFLAKQLLPTTAEDQWLDDQGSSWGLTRNAASYSSGNLVLTGSNGNVIPINTVYLSALGIEYLTQASGTIASGTATVAVKARTAGAVGDLPSGSVLTAQSPVPGVADAGTTGALTGGTDKESNEAYRGRILARIRSAPAGGSEAVYKAWARAVAGVERAWVYGGYYGAGTVAIVITATGSDPVPGSPLVAAVAAYIDPLRPVTAAVTVAPIIAAIVDFDISVTPNIPEVTDLIEQNLAELLEAEATPSGLMYLSHIQRAIASAGVLDYIINSIEVDGVPIPLENYLFTDFAYPVLGSVTIGAL